MSASGQSLTTIKRNFDVLVNRVGFMIILAEQIIILEYYIMGH